MTQRLETHGVDSPRQLSALLRAGGFFLAASVALGIAPSLTGCVAQNDDLVSGTSDDITVTATDVVGPLAVGEARAIALPKGTGYRAYKLKLTAKTKVGFTVTSYNGVPAAYLLDASFQTLAKRVEPLASDAPHREEASARVFLDVPSDDTYYLAFRDRSGAAASFTVTFVGAIPSTPAQCTKTSQCPSGSCFLNRCVQSKEGVVPEAIDAFDLAYDDAGALQLASAARAAVPFIDHLYRPPPTYSLLVGSVDVQPRAKIWILPDESYGSGFRPKPFGFDHTPNGPAVLDFADSDYLARDRVSFGDVDSERFLGVGPGTVRSYDATRSADGTQHVGVLACVPEGAGTKAGCGVYYASRRPGAAWSALETVTSASEFFTAQLWMHPRANGGVDILFGQKNGSLGSWGRVSAGVWSTRTVLSRSGWQFDYAFAHGADGHTHAIVTENLPNPQSAVLSLALEAHYLEIGDNGDVVRSFSLETNDGPGQYPTIAVDGSGYVYAEERYDRTRPSLVRIDALGDVLRSPLGDNVKDAPKGGPFASRLAVSKSGAVAFGWLTPPGTSSAFLTIRRFTP